jgi:hypothetical protein
MVSTVFLESEGCRLNARPVSEKAAGDLSAGFNLFEVALVFFGLG